MDPEELEGAGGMDTFPWKFTSAIGRQEYVFRPGLETSGPALGFLQNPVGCSLCSIS